MASKEGYSPTIDGALGCPQQFRRFHIKTANALWKTFD